MVLRIQIYFFEVDLLLVRWIERFKPPFKRCNKIYEGGQLLKFILRKVETSWKNSKSFPLLMKRRLILFDI